MRIIDCVQGTDEWRRAKIGTPSASCFHKIVTPKTCKPSSQQTVYMAHLFAEWVLDEPIDDGSTQFMERGVELEESARYVYEMLSEEPIERVGFCVTDDGMCGCSPDMLVGERGGAECKAPAATTHGLYMLDDSELTEKYWAQVQGCLYVTGRDWWDLFSYHPTMPPVRVRVTPDAKYHAAIGPIIKDFCARLDGHKRKHADLREKSLGGRVRRQPPVLDTDPFATEETPFDIEGILKGMPNEDIN